MKEPDLLFLVFTSSVFCADHLDSSTSSPSVNFISGTREPGGGWINEIFGTGTPMTPITSFQTSIPSTSFNLPTTTTAESAPPLEGCSGTGSSASRRSIENLKPQFNVSFFVSIGEESVGKDMSLVQFRKGLEGEVVLSLAIRDNTIQLTHSRVVLQSQVPEESSCFFVSIRQFYWKNKFVTELYIKDNEGETRLDAENDSPEEYNNLEIDIGDVVEADSFVMIEYYSNDVEHKGVLSEISNDDNYKRGERIFTEGTRYRSQSVTNFWRNMMNKDSQLPSIDVDIGWVKTVDGFYLRNHFNGKVGTYGNGGGTKDFEISSRIKEADSWQFCLNGTMNNILSVSDEDTLFFPLEEARSMRHVRIKILSNYMKWGPGGLQYFSENAVGTPGASYQVCPLEIQTFEKFKFSSLGQMYIDRGSGVQLESFEDLLVNIPHEDESIIVESPEGYSFPSTSDVAVSSVQWTCQSDGSLVNSTGGLLRGEELVFLPPCPQDSALTEPCVCSLQLCSSGEICQTDSCTSPCQHLGLQPHRNILRDKSQQFLSGTQNFTCKEGHFVLLKQGVRADQFTATCRGGQWVEEDGLEDMSCKDSSRCYDPPPTSDLLTSDFDQFKIDPGDTFTFSCQSEDKVQLSFSTKGSGEKGVSMTHAKILKLKEPGATQIFRFRIKPFEKIRLHFNTNKGLLGKFPVIDLTVTGIEFGRQIDDGIVDTKKTSQHHFEADTAEDFVLYTAGTQVQVGGFEGSQLVILGSYEYSELDSLPYVGFSSSREADWVLENGLSGAKILVEGTYHRTLEMVCEVASEDTARWKLRPPVDLSSVSCVPAHSCSLTNISRDQSVVVTGLTDHLGQHLYLTDGVPLGGTVLARCLDTDSSFAGSSVRMLVGSCVEREDSLPGLIWLPSLPSFSSSLPTCSE